MITNLEVLISFDLILTTSIMQSADESVSEQERQRQTGSQYWMAGLHIQLQRTPSSSAVPATIIGSLTSSAASPSTYTHTQLSLDLEFSRINVALFAEF